MSTIMPSSKRCTCQLGKQIPRSLVSQTTAPAGPRTSFQLAGTHTCLLQHVSRYSSHRPILTASAQKSAVMHAESASSPDPTERLGDCRTFPSYFGHLPPQTQSFRRRDAQRFPVPYACQKHHQLQDLLTSFPHVLSLRNLRFLDDVVPLLQLLPSCILLDSQSPCSCTEVMSKLSTLSEIPTLTFLQSCRFRCVRSTVYRPNITDKRP